MPVDEDINLDSPDGLTEEDIRKMEAIANDLEILARQSEEAVERIKNSNREASKPLEGKNFAELEIIQKQMKGGGETGSLENVSGIGSMDIKQLQALIIKVIKDLEEEKKKNKEQEKEIDASKKQLAELKSKLGSIREAEGTISSLLSNPAELVKSKGLALLGKAGIWGAVLQFTIQMGQTIYSEVVDYIEGLFGAGGKFDIRKMVLDNVKTITSIDHLIKINTGQVYFTSDTSEILRQGVFSGLTVNTRNALNGHREHNRLII